ncbi:hypothetical protein VN24_17165 [Paenibacillus beijingensis]|uniref:Uncharacterized protein n=1 Tax=Paenibacillus beijingensis TaxID=1126833 RepID=A0A0D5NLT4_9BACL|nr:hypothetical protein VN24_17165 [Paenibacillus beijingensis]
MMKAGCFFVYSSRSGFIEYERRAVVTDVGTPYSQEARGSRGLIYGKIVYLTGGCPIFSDIRKRNSGTTSAEGFFRASTKDLGIGLSRKASSSAAKVRTSSGLSAVSFAR